MESDHRFSRRCRNLIFSPIWIFVYAITNLDVSGRGLLNADRPKAAVESSSLRRDGKP